VARSRTGHRLDIQNDTAGALAKRVGAGERFDVLMLTPAALKTLAAEGRVVPDSVTPLATVDIGVSAVSHGFGAAPIELRQPVTAERVLAQHQLEVMRRGVADVVQLLLTAPGLCLLLALGLRAGLDDLNAGAFAQGTHGLAELQPLDALHELDRVARLMAAEAIVEAALRVDMEARRLLFVEGAHADVAATALLQPDGLPDQLYDPNLPPHAVEGLLSDHEPDILQIASEERTSLQKRHVFAGNFRAELD